MTNNDRAEQLMRRRAASFFVLSIAYILVQGAFVDGGGNGASGLRVTAWLVMSLVLLVFFATGGGWARSRAVRALMNDESTRLHRARATTIAFYNMMATGVVIYLIAMLKPVNGGQAAHVIMTVGIASALMAFAGWERLALRHAGR